VKTGFADKPVNYVSFYDALRFANWLNNGQASASTEIGAYTLLGGTATPSNGATVSRNAEARIFLTNEHEWYKAAFYNSTSSSYFKYPAGTDATTLCAAPTATANHANCDSAAGGVTAVGAYTGSASPYGTYDQGGNVWEWNEENVSSYRGFRGGTWGGVSSFLAADWTDVMAPETESEYVGFRIARFVPATPSVPIGGVVMPVVAGLLAMTGLVGLAGRPRPLTRDSG
jgi:formylglycine-generating enzyme required for sulfatase activity